MIGGIVELKPVGESFYEPASRDDNMTSDDPMTDKVETSAHHPEFEDIIERIDGDVHVVVYMALSHNGPEVIGVVNKETGEPVMLTPEEQKRLDDVVVGEWYDYESANRAGGHDY